MDHTCSIVSKITNNDGGLSEYLNKPKLVNIEFLLNMFDDDQGKAKKSFVRFNNEANDDKCLDLEEKRQVTDEEARNIINKTCQVKNPIDLQKSEKVHRNSFLKELKENQKLSIRQIETNWSVPGAPSILTMRKATESK